MELELKEYINTVLIENRRIVDLSKYKIEQFPEELAGKTFIEELYMGFFDDFSSKENNGFVSYGNCKLTEIPEELNSLKSLRVLVLGGMFLGMAKPKIKDFSPLWKLNKLETLVLYSNRIKSIHGIEHLTKLKHLVLDYTEIEDYSPISSLTNLETLSLGDCNITNLSFIENLRSLKNIKVTSNQITSIDPIKNSTQLERLCACHNEIESLEILSQIPRLKYLCLNGTGHYSKPQILKSIPNLEEVTGFYLTFETTKNNINLEVLELNQVNDSHLDAITNYPKLKKLKAYGDFKTIGNISNLKYLEELELFSDDLIDISSLNNSKLKRLFIRGSKLQEIQNLNLPNIKSLELYTCPIQSLEFINSLMSIEKIELSRTKLKNLNDLDIKILKNVRLKLDENEYLLEEQRILKEETIEDLIRKIEKADNNR